MTKKGLFITFEGIEGVGKSTLIQFIAKYFQDHSIQFLLTREPGGTPLAEKLRDLILHDQTCNLDHMSELLVMFAARSNHLQSVIKPALNRGCHVLCDRFIDATYAYQGAGKGISTETIQTLEMLVQESLTPDCTFLLDAPVALGLERIRKRSVDQDKMEKQTIDFFERVRSSYLSRAQQFSDRFVIIDAVQPESTVQQEAIDIIKKLLDDVA